MLVKLSGLLLTVGQVEVVVLAQFLADDVQAGLAVARYCGGAACISAAPEHRGLLFGVLAQGELGLDEQVVVGVLLRLLLLLGLITIIIAAAVLELFLLLLLVLEIGVTIAVRVEETLDGELHVELLGEEARDDLEVAVFAVGLDHLLGLGGVDKLLQVVLEVLEPVQRLAAHVQHQRAVEGGRVIYHLVQLVGGVGAVAQVGQRDDFLQAGHENDVHVVVELRQLLGDDLRLLLLLLCLCLLLLLLLLLGLLLALLLLLLLDATAIVIIATGGEGAGTHLEDVLGGEDVEHDLLQLLEVVGAVQQLLEVAEGAGAVEAVAVAAQLAVDGEAVAQVDETLFHGGVHLELADFLGDAQRDTHHFAVLADVVGVGQLQGVLVLLVQVEDLLLFFFRHFLICFLRVLGRGFSGGGEDDG